MTTNLVCSLVSRLSAGSEAGHLDSANGPTRQSPHQPTPYYRWARPVRSLAIAANAARIASSWRSDTHWWGVTAKGSMMKESTVDEPRGLNEPRGSAAQAAGLPPRPTITNGSAAAISANGVVQETMKCQVPSASGGDRAEVSPPPAGDYGARSEGILTCLPAEGWAAAWL
jgi:hypothetical protein